MMNTGRSPAGAVVYGLLFVIVVPAGLLSWAVVTDGIVTVSGVQSIPLGLAGAITGFGQKSLIDAKKKLRALGYEFPEAEKAV